MSDAENPTVDADILLRESIAASDRTKRGRTGQSGRSNPSGHSSRRTSQISHFSTGKPAEKRRYATSVPHLSQQEIAHAEQISEATYHIKRASKVRPKLTNVSKFEPLKGKENYLSWTRNIHHVFRSNAVDKIVYGDVIYLPENHRYFYHQDRFVHHAEEIIRSHLSPQILENINDSSISGPQELWRALRLNYKPHSYKVAENGITKFEDCKLSNYQTFDQFKNAFNRHWSQIHDQIEDNERTKCLWFIRKLDSDKWENWKTNLQSRLTASSDPERELLRFATLVSEIENQTTNIANQTTKTYSAKGQNPSQNSNPNGGRNSPQNGKKSHKTKCKYCQKGYHSLDQC
jgi:hypothetical protein